MYVYAKREMGATCIGKARRSCARRACSSSSARSRSICAYSRIQGFFFSFLDRSNTSFAPKRFPVPKRCENRSNGRTDFPSNGRNGFRANGRNRPLSCNVSSGDYAGYHFADQGVIFNSQQVLGSYVCTTVEAHCLLAIQGIRRAGFPMNRLGT